MKLSVKIDTSRESQTETLVQSNLSCSQFNKNLISSQVRRSESLLRQAADSVSKGQTFQTVSDMFQIPISTIR